MLTHAGGTTPARIQPSRSRSVPCDESVCPGPDRADALIESLAPPGRTYPRHTPTAGQTGHTISAALESPSWNISAPRPRHAACSRDGSRTPTGSSNSRGGHRCDKSFSTTARAKARRSDADIAATGFGGVASTRRGHRLSSRAATSSSRSADSVDRHLADDTRARQPGGRVRCRPPPGRSRGSRWQVTMPCHLPRRPPVSRGAPTPRRASLDRDVAPFDAAMGFRQPRPRRGRRRSPPRARGRCPSNSRGPHSAQHHHDRSSMPTGAAPRDAMAVIRIHRSVG